jgi:hypothetical protein
MLEFAGTIAREEANGIMGRFLRQPSDHETLIRRKKSASSLSHAWTWLSLAIALIVVSSAVAQVGSRAVSTDVWQ